MSGRYEVDGVFLNKFMLWNYPTVIGQTIILLEAVRVLPAEIRIYRRAWKRRRFNAAETLLLAMKYLAILGWTLDAVVRETPYLPSARSCYTTHYVAYFCILFATSLVALAIAWRTYIIFQCNRTVYWILAVALSGQIALSMWSVTMQIKSNVHVDGWCDAQYSDEYLSIPRVRQSAPWYLSYNFLYDLLISIASTYHLAKSAGAPFGLSNISRTLFYNNIHYVLIVCTVNCTELVTLLAVQSHLPNMLFTSCALQIITAMNMLVIEQDLVHQPSSIRVSHAPGSRVKGSASDLNGGSNGVAITSVNTNGTWQTRSKETSTFQTDFPIESPTQTAKWTMGDKRMVRDDGALGVTYAQKCHQVYDEDFSDMEKQDYSPNWIHNGSPKNEEHLLDFIIANPDPALGSHTVQIRPITPQKPSTQSNKSFLDDLATPPPARTRLDSPVSGRVQFEMSPTITSASQHHFESKPTHKKEETPLSIRSIRAKMNTASVDEYASTPLSTSTQKRLKTTESTTAAATALTTSFTAAHARVQQSEVEQPTFEISAGPGSPMRPRQNAARAPDSCTSHSPLSTPSLQSLNNEQDQGYSGSNVPALQRPSFRSTRSNTSSSSASMPRQRATNTNPSLNVSHHDASSSSDDELDSERGVFPLLPSAKASPQVKAAHGPRRVSSLEMGSDPFRP